MNDTILPSRLNRQAISDLLWHRFQIQHGLEFIPVLGLGTETSNYSALVRWVDRRVDFYLKAGVEKPLLYLEAELSEILLSSGIPGGALDESINTRMPDLPPRAGCSDFSSSRLRVIQGKGRVTRPTMKSKKSKKTKLTVLTNKASGKERTEDTGTKTKPEPERE
jgi:hypothetical protein